MQLQTTIPWQPSKNPVGYASRILLLGSCFVENIGKKLDFYQFATRRNPFGILFHPFAIQNLIHRALASQWYTKDEVFMQNGRWLCFDAHSDLAATSQERLVDDLNNALRSTKEELESATHLIITLGTAWVYRNKATTKAVANCHKVPQREFDKELLKLEQISTCLNGIVAQVTAVNPKAQLIFTLSPVRHIKDGFVENQRSKSHLLTAIHQCLSQNEATAKVSYFESYEVMMDELRDYRFYDKDMVHPNSVAVDYIWERFKSVWISQEEYEVMHKVEEVQKGLNHRPFNPESSDHQKFLQSLEAKITYLLQRYPFMKFR